MASSIGDINVSLGESFEVKLESQTGSTGYVWALSFMPDCVNLVDVRYESTSSVLCGSKSSHVFVFVAVREDQSQIGFKLIRPWDPLKAAKQTVFALIIKPAPNMLERELEDTIGSCRFVAGESQQGGWRSIASVTDLCMEPYKFRPLYGIIPPYGIPIRVVENEANCLLAYGTPQGIAGSGEECVLKYGFPLTMCADTEDCRVKYGIPVVKYGSPVIKYGVPVMKYGFPIHIREDADNCLLKYGCPVEIVEDPDKCIIKYGVPGVMDEASENCLVKYGIPVEIKEDAENCVVKYGIPTGIARDSESCVIKYGSPVKAEEDPENCLLKYGVPVDPKDKS